MDPYEDGEVDGNGLLPWEQVMVATAPINMVFDRQMPAEVDYTLRELALWLLNPWRSEEDVEEMFEGVVFEAELVEMKRVWKGGGPDRLELLALLLQMVGERMVEVREMEREMWKLNGWVAEGH